MNPFEYIESVKERLSTDSIVLGFDISREFSNLNEAGRSWMHAVKSTTLLIHSMDLEMDTVLARILS